MERRPRPAIRTRGVGRLASSADFVRSKLARVHRDGDVLHAAELSTPRLRAPAWKIEERSRLSLPMSKNSASSPCVAVLHQLDQAEAYHPLVELDRVLDVATDQRHVVDSASRRRRTAPPGDLHVRLVCHCSRRAANSAARSTVVMS